MRANGLARIGKDVEVRYSPNGDAIANLSLAFTYGKKGADGKRPTQWVDATLWGKRAESLAPYLKKGGQIVVYLSDINIQTYDSKSGQGVKLVGKVDDLELIGSKVQTAQVQPERAPVPSRGLTDLDSDLPF